jgi:hypothetical protein
MVEGADMVEQRSVEEGHNLLQIFVSKVSFSAFSSLEE